MPYGKRDFEADDAQEAEDRVKRAQARQLTLDYVRGTAMPQLSQSLGEILVFLKALTTQQLQENDLLKNYILPIAIALENFCSEAIKIRGCIDVQALVSLTQEDVFGNTKSSLDRISLLANAVRLINAVVEDIKKPEINLNEVHQKLKAIEKIAKKFDDPKSIAKRKLAAALVVAALVLLALVLVAIVVIASVVSSFSIPAVIGFLLGAGAFGAMTTGIAIKGMTMRVQPDYQSTPLSRSLHVFRDVVKDGLVGKTASARCDEYKIFRNVR